MGTPLGAKYMPYTYMDPLGVPTLGHLETLGWLQTPALRQRATNGSFQVLP